MTNHVNVQKVHKQIVKSVHKFCLAYIHSVQHMTAGDHQLDQVEFSYRFA